MILSLDISLNSTGYAILSQHNDLKPAIIDFGTIQTKKSEGDFPQETIERTEEIYLGVFELLERNDIKEVVIEQITRSKFPMTAVKLSWAHYAAFQAIIQFGLIDKVTYYYPSQWRKLLSLKKGKCWKQASIDYVNREFHMEFKKKDNDIADAVAMGYAHLL